MTTPRTRGLHPALLALMILALCLVMAAPAVAEKKAGALETPRWAMIPPPMSGVGIADGRLLSFAYALNELASSLETSIGASGGQHHQTITSKTELVVCGFKVTSTFEDSSRNFWVKGPMRKEVEEGHTSLNLRVEVAPESVEDSEGKKPSFLLKSFEETTKLGTATPDHSFRLDLDSKNAGITELIQHAKSQGCTVEEAQGKGLSYTLIRMPEPAK